MRTTEHKSVMSALKVREAMRKLLVQVPGDVSLEEAIRRIIKYRVNAILVTDRNHEAIGVVSKTNLVSAYYAGLTLDTPVESVMDSPPLYCRPDDSLDHALDTMRTHKVHRLYVFGDVPKQAIGVLAYPDIVGLLYRYCRGCERNIARAEDSDPESMMTDRFRVSELMVPSVQTHQEDETLTQLMEGIVSNRIGAVLINDARQRPTGVVSKTDLIIAYKHQMDPDAPARSIMSSPVRSIDQNEPLVTAVQRMILCEVNRMFVYKDSPDAIVGVLSLTSAARARSGSCRACMSTRIKLEDAPPY